MRVSGSLGTASSRALGLALCGALAASLVGACTPRGGQTSASAPGAAPPPTGAAPGPYAAYPQPAPGAPPPYGYAQQPYPSQNQAYAQPYPVANPAPAAPGQGAPAPAPQSSPPAYAPAPSPAYPAAPAPQPAPAPPATSAAAAPAGPLGPTDPGTLQAIVQGIQGALQGQLVTPGSIPSDLVEAGLKLHAAHVAPGMQPEGSELRQDIGEGQHAVMMVTLQAGKCYTLVGFSPIGAVRDLDLNLLAPPFYLTLAGQDLSRTSMPVIGAAPSPMCPVIAFPLQYKLDVFAKSGSGAVAVQLYSKNK